MRKLKSIKALAYSILATLVILSSTLVASAQLPQCEVSGTIYRGDGSPAVSIPVTIVKVVKAGSLISTRSITLRSGVDGSITLTLPRESTAYIYADARGLNNNGPAGVPLPIPNSDTASLESLVSIGSIPVNGITVIDSSDVTLSNVIGTFKFGSGLSITHSPTGQVNISSTAAFSVREVDTSPSVSSPPIIEFDQADGFVVSNSSSNARIDLAGIPVNKLAALTPSRVVVTDGSGFIVDSAVAASDIQNALKLRSVDIASTTPTNGKVLKYNSSNSSWEPADDNDSGGTVTGVNATVPAELSVSGVPITGAGTIAITWNVASGRKFIASPDDGSSGAYVGRAIAAADLPDLSSLYQPLDTQLTSLASLSYSGNALKIVRVNAGETGFELVTSSGGGGDSVSVNGSAADDANLITGSRISFSLNTGSTPDEISADIVADSVGPTQIDETAAYSFSGANSFSGRTTRTGGLVVTPITDADDHTVLASEEEVHITDTSAPRVVTLPSISSVPDGWRTTIFDKSNAANGTNTITITRAGSDTFLGGATSVIISCSGCSAGIKRTGSVWSLW